jgi:hypothetical protein
LDAAFINIPLLTVPFNVNLPVIVVAPAELIVNRAVEFVPNISGKAFAEYKTAAPAEPPVGFELLPTPTYTVEESPELVNEARL